METEHILSKNLRSVAAASLILFCASQANRVLPLPVDSVSASTEANVWMSVNDSLRLAGFEHTTGLKILPDGLFEFDTKVHGTRENCQGHYQPKTKSYAYIGYLVCN